MDSDILTISDAARHLQLSKESLYRYARAKVIPATKVGRHWRFSRAELDAWVRRRGPGGAAEADTSRTAPAQAPKMGCRVLVVDDDPAIRKLIAAWVRQAGHEAMEAVNGGDAVRLVREAGVDLVLLDVHLPDMNAPQILSEMFGTGLPPVVLITGDTGSRVLDAALEHAVVYVLGKPFSRDELLGTLRFARSGS